MKNRTIYDVLDQVMENYTYTIEQTGKKVCLSGKVYIERIDTTVTHEKTFYKSGDINDTYMLEAEIKKFKEGLRDKVAEVIKSHAEELTDDEEMIKKLQYEIATLKKAISQTEQELCDARAKIAQFELEKTMNTPYTPYTPPCPTYPEITPWGPCTWGTSTGDSPDWYNDFKITSKTTEDELFLDRLFNEKKKHDKNRQ